jgi:ATP-dependent protease ClpP protease subunit
MKIKKLSCLVGLLPLLASCAEMQKAPITPHETVYVMPDKTDPSASAPKVLQPVKTQAVINFAGKVTLKKTNDLTSYIHKQMQEGVSDFILNINSSGGDSDAGISAYQYLKQLPISITTYNTGNVQSAAALLYCSGTKRYTLAHSFFMLHGSATTYTESMFLHTTDLD